MNDPHSTAAFNNANRIAYLIAGFIRQSLSEEEHDELDNWINESDHNMKLFEELTDEDNIAANMEWMDKVNSEASYKKLKESGAFDLPPKRRSYRRVWMVAATVLLLVAAFFIYRYSFNNKKAIDKDDIASTIIPGGEKATLTLASGEVYDLTKLPTGEHHFSDSSSIRKLANGEIVYGEAGGTVVQHVLTTPVGGQYQITLPDGSKVWLNAASSLTYPSQFTGNERIVGLTGEGYFEVAKVPGKTFEVFSGGAQVKVLGTHFNINGYANEPAFTATLLEGSIKILKNGEVAMLQPGQQAIIHDAAIAVGKADTVEAVAWKNNEFKFTNATIETIMRQVQRWYAAEVEYRDKVDDHFNATVDRTEPVTNLLHYLEATGHVHFKLEKNKIIVMK